MKMRSIYCYCLFLLLLPLQVDTVTIGSDTAVNRFDTQQFLNNGDEVAAFAALEGGFALTSASVQATMRTSFQVTGDIELNGGTLVLGRDLMFKEVSNFKTLGTILGNNYSLEFAATMTCIPSNIVANNCLIPFLTSAAQAGAVLTVDWSFDNKIVAIGIDANAGLVITYLFNGTTLTFADSDVPGGVTDVRAIRWHPSALLLAVGKKADGGDDLYTYSVNSSGILTQVDSDDVGSISAVAWQPTGDYLATAGEESSAEIRLYPVDSGGDLDIANRLDVDVSPDQKVENQALDWDTTGSYLAVGLEEKSPEANFKIYEFNNQPSLSLVENAGDVLPKTVLGVSWHPTCPSIIAIGIDDTTDNLRIYNHDGSLGTVTELTSLDLPALVRTLHWSPDGACLAVGTDKDTEELIVYSFSKSTFELTQVEAFDFSDNVRAVRWDHTGDFLAVGNDDASLYIYGSASSGDCFTFSQINIVLKCNVEFKDCCIIFSGDTTIRGRGKCLTIQPTCTLVVDTESSLLLKDITIKGVQDSNIQFMDNSSTISLQDVTWVLDDDYTFTNGHFDVLKDFEVIGSGKKITYQSEVQSTIQECGKMILDDGVTFSYDPVTESRDLLLLTFDTSELVLNGATLHSTSTGLRLTTGVLTVNQESFLSSEGSVDSESISLGDGINTEKNLCLNILPAARLELLQGCLAYNNV